MGRAILPEPRAPYLAGGLSGQGCRELSRSKASTRFWRTRLTTKWNVHSSRRRRIKSAPDPVHKSPGHAPRHGGLALWAFPGALTLLQTSRLRPMVLGVANCRCEASSVEVLQLRFLGLLPFPHGCPASTNPCCCLLGHRYPGRFCDPARRHGVHAIQTQHCGH
jgi:hypothetical protein